MIEKIKEYMFLIIVCTMIFGFLGFGIVDCSKQNERRDIRVKSGELIEIDGRWYSIEKTTLRDGNCYYVYTGGRQTFSIPCEK